MIIIDKYAYWKDISHFQKNFSKEAIDGLINAPFDFFLTGSYAFGNTHCTSDVDFYAQNSQDVEDFLRNNGFFCSMHGQYSSDLLLRQIFCHDHIHIQLVSDIDIKHKVQAQLFQLPRDLKDMCLFDKKTARTIWQVLTTIEYRKHYSSIKVSVVPKRKDYNSICPLCGFPGDDMIFSFYCSNPKCSKFRP